MTSSFGYETPALASHRRCFPASSTSSRKPIHRWHTPREAWGLASRWCRSSPSSTAGRSRSTVRAWAEAPKSWFDYRSEPRLKCRGRQSPNGGVDRAAPAWWKKRAPSDRPVADDPVPFAWVTRDRHTDGASAVSSRRDERLIFGSGHPTPLVPLRSETLFRPCAQGGSRRTAFADQTEMPWISPSTVLRNLASPCISAWILSTPWRTVV